MKEIGQRLKKAREAKNIELSEVSLSVKINSRILKAIEEWDEAHLPPKTFLRGFLYTYASFLGLDSDEILKAFYSEIGSTKPKPYLDSQQLQANKISEAQSSQLAAQQLKKSKEETPRDLTSVSSDIESNAKEMNTKSATISAKPTPPSNLHSADQEKLNGVQINSRNRTVSVIRNTLIIAVLLGALIATKRKMDSYDAEGQVTQEKTLEEVPISIPAESSPAVDPKNTLAIKTVTGSSAIVAPGGGSSVGTVAGSTNANPATSTSTAIENKASELKAKSERPPGSEATSSTKPVANGTVSTTSPQTAESSNASQVSVGSTVESETPVVSAQAVPPTVTLPVKIPVKPQVKPEIKQDAKSELKPEAKLEAKPEVKPEANKPEVKPETKPETKPEATPEVKATLKPVIKPEVKREILIEALGPVTIEITFNGKTEKITLSPDEVRTIRSTTPIKLKASNGGALNVSKNGKDLGIPGNLGQSVEVEY